MVVIYVVVLFLLYFLPSLIAVQRKHKNSNPICIVNLLLGWTFIGWVIAMVWGMTDNVQELDKSKAVPLEDDSKTKNPILKTLVACAFAFLVGQIIYSNIDLGKTNKKKVANSSNSHLTKTKPQKDSITKSAPSECKKFVVINSAESTAKEMGTSPAWVLANYKVNIWANPSPKKFPKVGETRPGSHALIIEEGKTDYKIKSPLDKSIGWVSKIQVERTVMQDTKTNKVCKG